MSAPSPTRLNSSGILLGYPEARIFTPPLRELTPETSKGFQCIEFSEKVLGISLLPWQKWLLIHALELNEDGSFRFRTVVVLVARQNGKTFLLSVLALYRLYVDNARLVLGTSHILQGAQEAWKLACDTVTNNVWLNGKVYRGVGSERLVLPNEARYLIRAANETAGRGLSVDLLIIDEMLKQKDFAAWSALSKTTMARKEGQVFGISTPGGVEAVLLNHLHDQALAELASGTTDESDLGLFEYSAPLTAELDDPDAIAHANPALGHTIGMNAITGSRRTDPPAVYRTEVLCQRVQSLVSAIDMAAWQAGFDPSGTLNNVRSRLAFCLDVSPNNMHATLCAAAIASDGKVRVGVIKAWSGKNTINDVRLELPILLDRLKPRVMGWFPNGPAAGIAADLKTVRKAEPIKATEVNQACMGLAEQVTARRILHNGDALLAAHARAAEKMQSGDGWKFKRRLEDIDAIYAAAGAVHLARTFPMVGRPRIVVARS